MRALGNGLGRARERCKRKLGELGAEGGRERPAFELSEHVGLNGDGCCVFAFPPALARVPQLQLLSYGGAGG